MKMMATRRRHNMAFDPSLKVPKKMFDMDPKGKKPDEDTADYWKKEAAAARAKREYIEENKMAERLNNPPEQPEPPFKISGSVNLGNIDVQEQQRQQAETTEKARTEAQERVTKAEEERDAARKALNEAQIDHVKAELGNKIDELKGAIANNNRGDFGEQLGAIMKLAGMLGFEKPKPGPTDSALTLEIKKLEWQMKKEDRDFQRQMKKDEREWQIELKKLDQQAKDAETRARAEREKYMAFANVPERIGAVVVQGMADRANGEQGQTIQKKAQKNKPQATYHIEASEGEAGEVACPQCKTPIGIAPNARSAECVNCHTKIDIKRIPVTEAGQTSKENSEFIT
jgi:hypothetical protein